MAPGIDATGDLEAQPLSRAARTALLLVMPAVPLTCAPVFFGAVESLGTRLGTLAGFAFYWAVWCYGVPLALLGPRGARRVLRAARPRGRLERAAWLAIAAFPVVGGALTVMPGRLARADLAAVALSVVLAIVNAFGEELLWRGVGNAGPVLGSGRHRGTM